MSTTPWRHFGEWRYSSTHSLTSALDGGEWSASRPGRFTPKERVPGTHWKGGWVGPRAVLNAVVKRKIPNARRESNPRTLIVQPVSQRYTDWAITAMTLYGIGNSRLKGTLNVRLHFLTSAYQKLHRELNSFILHYFILEGRMNVGEWVHWWMNEWMATFGKRKLSFS
jgi:hypothetical protein